MFLQESIFVKFSHFLDVAKGEVEQVCLVKKVLHNDISISIEGVCMFLC